MEPVEENSQFNPVLVVHVPGLYVVLTPGSLTYFVNTIL